MSLSGKRTSSNNNAQAPAESELLRSAKVLSQILDIAEDAVITTTREGTILAFNKGAERIFGHSADDVIGEDLGILIPSGHRERHDRHVREFVKSPTDARAMAQRSVIYGLRRNGEEFPAEASISKVSDGDQVILTAFLRDISDRAETEGLLRTALKEKDVLLGEIHHRVRNNLQVISSLLNLQARATKDPVVRQAFDDSQSRVQSMALIHQQLYEASSFASVELADYVGRLARHLFRAFGEVAERAEFELDIQGVSLAVDRAAPCGLIINELLSNSLKYAFADGRRGRIYVSAHYQPDRSILLKVGDDGPGLPPEVGFWNTDTLGLRLVRTLVRQIDGELEIAESPGAEFRIRFSDRSS